MTLLTVLGMLAMLALIAVQFFWLDQASAIEGRNRQQELIAKVEEIAHRVETEELLFILKELELAREIQGNAQGNGQLYGPQTIAQFRDFVKEHSIPKYAELSNFDLLELFTVESLVETVMSDEIDGKRYAQAKFRSEASSQFVADMHRRMREHRAKAPSMRLVASAADSLIETGIKRIMPDAMPRYAIVADTNQVKSRNGEVQAVAPLFESESTISIPLFLIVQVPAQPNVFSQEVLWLLILSGVIILIIGLTLVYMVNTIVQQKKLSEMRTDFINNMTHELKTPVATITLASEALLDKELAGSPSTVARFSQMIFDENERMKKHVERILNIAIIDKTDFELRYATLNLETIVRKALSQLELQLKEKGARVEYTSYSEETTFEGDEVHITNVVINLIDNAVKYSRPEVSPFITITSQNYDEGIILNIQDNGIGMTPDQARRVFEKFYRVPTGNVHNVKGFGLGLSYVRRIIERHGGAISVTSQPKQGTKFELRIPFQRSFSNAPTLAKT